MAVTIKDIAQAAGVSHPTVSRALRGEPGVSPEKAMRVRRIARELGYIPDAGARSLKTNRTGVIGVLVHRVSDPFYSQVLDGIQDSLYSAGYSVFLASSNNDLKRQTEIIRAMIERRVDGLIICSMYLSPKDFHELYPHGVPLVLIHNRTAEITPYTLYHDDHEGARRMTRHLVELGHSRIAFLGNKSAGRVSYERLAGYTHALKAAGLPVLDGYIVHAKRSDWHAAQEPVQFLLAQQDSPTALVCFDDMLAIGAMQVLHQANKLVPDDWSLTGFDDIAMAEFMSPALTTFNQPKYSLGTEAVNLLFRAMSSPADGDSLSTTVTLRGEMIVRASTAPARSFA